MEEITIKTSLLPLYVVLEDFREEDTDFKALASYYEHHYRVYYGKNVVLEDFILRYFSDPRTTHRDNIYEYWVLIHYLEVLERECVALYSEELLPPEASSEHWRWGQHFEYLRLQNTIQWHLHQLAMTLWEREQKLQEAAGEEQNASPAAEGEEEGAHAVEEEKEEGAPGVQQAPAAEEEEQREEGAPGEQAPAAEEREDGAPGEEQAPAVEEEEQREEGAPGQQQGPAAAEEEREERAPGQQQAPAAAEEEEREEGAPGEQPAPAPEEEREEGGPGEEQAPAPEEEREEEVAKERAPEVEETFEDPPVVERPTLRKRVKKAIMKRLRRVWHSTQRLTCCRRPTTTA
ncbi:caldesmon-like [Xenopus laevis]|uniref:Caldesmon-like n=1 Tax=Xenopus laevis TaxID=8355 RepID=A0A8J1MHS9_XENLA|nr:caldesmon-like [Xenopus laevis]XP_041441280.1 caldesmon-like [Xenopus laevis]XP_041441281.1 caldesmon-like [Xenopus laevis]XP_041441282.1 caldesmon-like [Xenopus laevis]XP_041441283.1 caldesmon-like [Xenopus laevis]XP_041441284.1 caldesmon-like [Xenopus laevis]XP_041441335.1 caldesmon-like [Xenopus laevis]XP_041441336.1 caldesmon-like [Xenopus laevis]